MNSSPHGTRFPAVAHPYGPREAVLIKVTAGSRLADTRDLFGRGATIAEADRRYGVSVGA